jgi:hypothetical protein
VIDYKFSGARGKITAGYNLHQRLLILGAWEKMGLLVPQATEDVMSMRGIIAALGLQYRQAKGAIDQTQANDPELFGEVKEYLFRRVVPAYNLHQRLLILQTLIDNGYDINRIARRGS